MRKYEILTPEDFQAFFYKTNSFINKNKNLGNPFLKMNIVVKSWRKDKTPKQHRYYWVVISEMVKAFRELGNEFSKDEVHEFVKKSNGFTKSVMLDSGVTVCMTRSISDNSNDTDTKKMGELIDFAIRFAAINLNYVIEDPRYGGQ